MDADLLTAATAWCDPRRVKILRTPVPGGEWWYEGERRALPPVDAATSWATIPPLLDQLQAATIPSGESGKGAGRGTGGGPDWDAIDILDQLRGHVQAARAQARLAGRDTLAAQIRQVCAHSWPDAERDSLARVLHHLAARADAHLVPDEVGPERHIRETRCPECGATAVPGIDSCGEAIMVPTIVVAFHRGQVLHAACQACGHRWDRAEMETWLDQTDVPA